MNETIKIPINPSLSLKQFNRFALFEGLDVQCDNGKFYAIIEVFDKHDFIVRQ